MIRQFKLALGFATLALMVPPAMAAPTLFNTGVNNVGAQLALGSVDSHWTVVETGTLAFVLNTQLVGTYVSSPTALYIWQQADGNPGSVTRTLRQTFDMTGFNPATAQITGRYSTDNSGIIRLNGVTVGPASNTFTAFTGFTLNTNFVAGVNTLDFVTTDAGAPAALMVDQLVLTATATSSNGPEPGTLALLSLGAVLALARRRKP